MSTLSVPLTPKLEEFIDSLVKSGKAANKAHAVRQALEWYQEEELIKEILESERDIKADRVFRGDLRKLMKKFND
ncbi:MAG TPA: hypothetical protein VJH94_00020 [Candidatus Paceibacterota bacterium]